MKETPPTDGLSLDGVPEQRIVTLTGQPRRALGSDPFAADPIADPFLSRLDSLPSSGANALRSGEPGAVHARSPGSAQARDPGSEATSQGWYTPEAAADPSAPGTLPPVEEPFQPAPAAAEPAADRQWRRTPNLDEVELPDVTRFAERFMDEDVRRRLAALSHLSEGGAPYDRFGFSPAAAQTAFPFFHAIYRNYFRVESQGHDQLPTDGPAVLASNHGGLLPFDGAMTIVDVLLHTDPPRLPRAVVDRWAGTLPWINVFFARVGQVVGTRENVMDLLGEGQLVLVFPEGMAGIQKRVTQRYQVQHFRSGFVAAALRTRAPIVPMAVIGADDQAPILFDLAGLAKRLSLPFFPVTPTFPWLGPLGLLPYPVGYRIIYGEPLHFHEEYGPEAADDPQLVRYLASQVRRKIQRLLDRNR